MGKEIPLSSIEEQLEESQDLIILAGSASSRLLDIDDLYQLQ